MADKGWQRRFDDPIPSPAGDLVTLRDAADYIVKLPARTANTPHWQTAMENLITAADHGGIVMLARIAVLQALHHGLPESKKPERRKAAKRYKIVR